MSMNPEEQAIAERIKALLSKTMDNGCTEAEAMSAAAKAAQLMQKHRLTHDDVELKAEKIGQIREETGRKRQHAAMSCCNGIAKYTGVKVWKMGADPVFFGLYNDVVFARHLFRLCVAAIDSAAEDFKKTAPYLLDPHKRSATNTFSYGMAVSMADKLRAMAAAEEPQLKTSNGTALVPLRNSLVNEAFAKRGIKLGKGRSGTISGSKSAFEMGKAAGEKVSFSRPVNGGETVRAIGAS